MKSVISIKATLGSALLRFFAVVACLPTFADSLRIEQVQPDRRQFDADVGESVTVRFRLSMPASVELRWFDPRDILVSTVRSSGILPAGEHAMVWGGRGNDGRVVPAEAYSFAVVARGQDGRAVEHDLTDITGGDDRKISDVRLTDGGLRYTLTRWSRVNVRIGLKDGGPLLRSLTDWNVRGPGEHVEPWDGKDVSGVLDVRQHPGLDLWGLEYALPENAIVVGTPRGRLPPRRSRAAGEMERTRKLEGPKRMYAHSQQAYDELEDFELGIRIEDSAGRVLGDGSVPAGQALRVGITAPPAAAARLAEQRFEIVYFFDGLFIRETEIAALPATWSVDPALLTPGEHFVTVNLRGHDGTFGYGSRKVRVVGPMPQASGAVQPSASK